MTIVKNPHSVKFYPLCRVTPRVRAAFERVVAGDPKTFPPNLGHKTLQGLLECYLDLRSENLTVTKLKAPVSNQLLAGFIGALRSESFVVGFGKAARGNYVSLFRKLLTALRRESLSGELTDNEACDAAWADAQLDSRAIEYWQGWFSGGDKGRLLSLHLVWHQLGPMFCQKTHGALVHYWHGREESISNSISLFNHLFAYIQNYAPETSTSTFTNAASFQQLIKGFGMHYFTKAKKEGMDIAVCRKRWEDWSYAVENALCNGHVWVKTKLPSAGGNRKSGSDNWIKTDASGVKVKEKFLVNIPVGATDEVALQTFTKLIAQSVNSVVNWSTAKSNEIIRAKIRALKLAAVGTNLLTNGRIIGNRRVVSEADLATTFEINSFSMFHASANFKGVINFTTRQAAEVLGIPIWSSLDPFVFLLINEHQDITEAFILSVDLVDEHGRESGLRKNDTGYVLVGYKKRRGNRKAEQHIILNERSVKVVKDIEMLTAPLREWMRSNNQPGWNKLLLNCSKGLSRPDMMEPSSRCRAHEPTIHRSIAPLPSSLISKSQEFCNRLSFTTFRATKALQLYFLDGDEISFALRLGHSRYSDHLMEHYLPKELRNFMKVRQITAVQTLLVTKALEGSRFQLSASGLQTQTELKEFLQTHKLHNMESKPKTPIDGIDTGEILLNMDHGLLALLAAIAYSVEQNIPIMRQFKEWAIYAQLLFNAAKLQKRNTNLQSKLLAAVTEGTTDRYLNLVRA